MKNGICPRCGSRKVHSGQPYSLDKKSGLRLSFSDSARLSYYVCGVCGLAESYVLDADDRERVASSWPRVEPVESVGPPEPEPAVEPEPGPESTPEPAPAPAPAPTPTPTPARSPARGPAASLLPPRVPTQLPPRRQPSRSEAVDSNELSLKDRLTVRLCLEALVRHPGLSDAEIQNFFRIDRVELRSVLREWPRIDHDDAWAATLILRTLEAIAEHPRGQHEDWKHCLGAPREDVKEALLNWRSLHQTAAS